MSRGAFGLVAATVLLAAVPAEAHPVVVDGITSDWSSRNTPFANMGIVARDGQQRGEYIFVDAAGDERTDLTGSTAVEQDIRRFQVTADADSISFLVRTTGADSTAPSQVQITIDLDRVAGSGQAALAGGA